MGKWFYTLFTSVTALAVFLMFYTPYLAFAGDPIASSLYNPGFSWACHQKISRSVCLFKDDKGSYSIADCTKQQGVYSANDRTQIQIINEKGHTGYKLPVCARDIGIYGALLLGSLIYPFMRKLNDKNVPPGIFLLLALVPIGIDGGLQLFSELGVSPFGLYESTNSLRLLTGAVAGIVLPFYIFPLFNYYTNNTNKKK